MICVAVKDSHDAFPRGREIDFVAHFLLDYQAESAGNRAHYTVGHSSMPFPLPYVLIQVLQNRGLLYYEIDDMENALQDFLATAKVHLCRYVLPRRIARNNLFSLVHSFYWWGLYSAVLTCASFQIVALYSTK